MSTQLMGNLKDKEVKSTEQGRRVNASQEDMMLET